MSTGLGIASGLASTSGRNATIALAVANDLSSAVVIVARSVEFLQHRQPQRQLTALISVFSRMGMGSRATFGFRLASAIQNASSLFSDQSCILMLSAEKGQSTAMVHFDVLAEKRAFTGQQLVTHLRRALSGAAWAYLVAVLGLLAFLRYGGDRWWLATLLLFGPRWMFGLPLIPLAAASLVLSRKLLWVLFAAGVIVLFPIMDMRVPWRRLISGDESQLRVLTYNVAGTSVTADALEVLIQQLQPDVVALQECRPDIYHEVFRDWHLCESGELLIAAKRRIRDCRVTKSLHPPHKSPRETLLQCILSTDVGDLRLCTVHLPSPRYGLAHVVDRRSLFAYSRRGLLEHEIQHRNQVSQEISQALRSTNEGLIVLGDLNMPTDSVIYQRDWRGLTNAFSQVGWGTGQSVRATMGGVVLTARVDHVLTDEYWRPQRCWIGPDMGSDHRPLVADLNWQGPSSIKQ